MQDIDSIFDLCVGAPPGLLVKPSRPISFVVVRFCDDYLYNFMISDCVKEQINEIIEVDNTSNLFFNSLTQAMVHGISQAQNELIIVVHEDVVLPNKWQPYFEESLRILEKHDPNWIVLGSVGWDTSNEIFGRWKDPVNFRDDFVDNPHGFEVATRLDEQILVFNRKRLPVLDTKLPGIHHIGRDLPRVAMASGGNAYVTDAPTIHKYADRYGNRIQSREDSDKIMDRRSQTYLADRACCNDYIMHKWPELKVRDYIPGDFTILFEKKEKLQQLNRPVIMLGRGGGGTRLLGSMAYDLGLLMGRELNPSMDCMDMVMPIYQGIVEKYHCFTGWQKSQITRRLQAAAARMIKDAPCDAIWGFKLPESILLLPELEKAFPDALYINFVRDPLATCLRRTHMTARLDNHIGRIALPLAYDYCEIDRSQILKDSPALHMTYTTIHQMELVSNHLKMVDENRKFETSFEQVLSHPTGELSRMAKWLGSSRKHYSLEGLIEPGRSSNPEQIYQYGVARRVKILLREIRTKLGYRGSPLGFRAYLSMFRLSLKLRR